MISHIVILSRAPIRARTVLVFMGVSSSRGAGNLVPPQYSWYNQLRKEVIV